MALKLESQKREKLGRSVKQLRAEGFIPAELYGKGIENAHLSVSAKEFKKVFSEAGESTMIDLMVSGEKTPVLVQDVQFDPVSDEILTVDFYQPRLDEAIEIDLPLTFEGESPAVKDLGGVLVKSMTEISVETLPTNIPAEIKVDLSQIKEIGQSIYVKELKIPQGVEVLDDKEMAVATVTEKISEEEDQAMSQAIDLDEIKTEDEEKKPEQQEAKDGDEAEEANS